MKVNWQGVFPAVCTQFHADYSLNVPGTLAHLDAQLAWDPTASSPGLIDHVFRRRDAALRIPPPDPPPPAGLAPEGEHLSEATPAESPAPPPEAPANSIAPGPEAGQQ